ncbi:MAG: hypothetical protein IH597_13305 [Bacteroidales bacterium]|nr:hypothetical protein [Bacteroidales bacterium]
MKRYLFLLLLSALFLQSCNLLPDAVADAITGATKTMATDGNSLFHQTKEVSLKTGTLTVEGEVKTPGEINLDNHYKQEVFIKESLYDAESGINFIGAYRYRGYSLFDLLHPFNHEKKNAEVFRPAIDLYVVIENATGERVSFSWSEIFHTNNPHQIIIATEAAPIVPYRKEVNYETGDTWKVVAANDLFAYRVLVDPVKITVYSFDKKEYVINRDLEPLYSQEIQVMQDDQQIASIPMIEDEDAYTRYYSSFYGMGMGYHAARYFQGPLLSKLLEGSIDFFDPELNRHGLVCFAGLDGYRSVYSYSELFNRTDQVMHILAVPENPMDGGFYRIFHPSEFYADRSVKSLAEIYFFSH